jgi:hypothetical protein
MDAYSSAANASKMSKISSMFSLPVPGVKGVPGASGGAIGGMPCKFQLVMEFFCSFLFTFIIYFCVFAFFPYDGIIKKILEFVQDTTKKFMDFINGLIPKSVKKNSSKLFPSFIEKFFKETLPKMLKAKQEELTTPLKKKLEQIKKDTDEKLKKENKKSGNSNNIFSKIELFFKETFLKIKAKLSEMWEKFKDKIIPALIISFVYYIIWLIFFKVIPLILKYLISVAQQFKQP